MRFVVRAVIVAMSLGSLAHARDSTLVAVMQLDVSQAKLEPAMRSKLEESIRVLAGDLLAPRGFTVLTGENTLSVLHANGVDLQKACEASCAVDMGRELKARYVISGAVATGEGLHSAFIRIYEVSTGGMLASIKVRGKTGTDLEDAIDERGRELFEKAGLLREGVTPPPDGRGAGPVIRRSEVKAALANLTVDATPRDRVRLVITEPGGRTLTSAAPYQNAQAAAGTWRVKATAAGFAEESREIVLRADEVKLEKVELKPLGGLAISGTEGAQVVVTGPNAFRDAGGLPWDATGLPSGTYTIEVIREGYAKFTSPVEVRAGETAKVRAELRRAGEAAARASPWLPELPTKVTSDPVADRRRDEAIVQINRILPKQRNPDVRADLTFQLGELWWEKSDFVRVFEELPAYAAELERWKACSSGCRAEPSPDHSKSNGHRRTALGMYSEVLRDTPEYRRADELRFIVGHALVRLAQDDREDPCKGERTAAGVETFIQLIRSYPNSTFVPNAHHLLGLYYTRCQEPAKARRAFEACAAVPRTKAACDEGLADLGG